MLDICFINPPTLPQNKLLPFFPLGLATLGGMLKRHGFSTKVVDLELLVRMERCSDEDILSVARRALEGIDTKLFGFTTVYPNYAISLLIADLIKEIYPTAKIIFGGPQASLIPLETLTAFPAVDMIVCGEGENTIIELLSSDLTSENLQKIAGLAIRVGEKPVLTSRRKLITNLDDLPLPDFSLLQTEKYFGEAHLNNEYLFVNHVEAGRGCPFNCTFCSTSLMWSRQYRVKSPKRILDEMKLIHDQDGFTRFSLIHDNFTWNHKYLSNFCEHLQKNNPGLRWGVNSRVDCLNEEKLKMMMESDCGFLFFGVESFSERIQHIIKKRLNLEGYAYLVKKCKEHNVITFNSLMLGFPDETIEDLETTLSNAVEYQETGMQNFLLYKVNAYPGTQLYKEQLPNLTLVKSPILNPEIFPNLPEVLELIERHPNIFSHAYSIPNPHFSDEAIYGLINLFIAGTYEYYDTIYDLMHEHGYRPWALWKEWKSWNELVYSNLPIDYKEAACRFPSFAQSLTSKQEPLDSPFLDSADIFAFPKDI